MAILLTPWIPKSRVKSVLMSYVEEEGSKTLENMGIQVIKTQPHPCLSKPVAHHPDMIFSYIKENTCVVNDKNQSFVSSLKNIGFSILEAKNNYSERYPNDIGLNCVILNDTVIGNIEFIDTVIKEQLSNYNFINVSQGYTKCSISIVNEHSLITEDESIYKALKNQFDVLKIESGCVELKGYNCGFFGGCNRSIDVTELKKGNLTDIGSIIPLEEK